MKEGMINLRLISNVLTKEQAKEIVNWKYEGVYEIYNLSRWDELVKSGCSLCDDIKRNSFRGYLDEDGQLVGFTNLLDEGDEVFFGIGLNPRMCGKGLGKIITKMAIEESKRRFKGKDIKLEVRTWNDRAINCYKSQGFEIIEIINNKTYIGYGEFYIMKYFNS